MTTWLLSLCAHVCVGWQAEGCGCFPVTEQTFSCDARGAFKAEMHSSHLHCSFGCESSIGIDIDGPDMCVKLAN